MKKYDVTKLNKNEKIARLDSLKSGFYAVSFFRDQYSGYCLEKVGKKWIMHDKKIRYPFKMTHLAGCTLTSEDLFNEGIMQILLKNVCVYLHRGKWQSNTATFIIENK